MTLISPDRRPLPAGAASSLPVHDRHEAHLLAWAWTLTVIFDLDEMSGPRPEPHDLPLLLGLLPKKPGR